MWPSNFDRHHTSRGELAISKYVELANRLNIAPSTFANAFVNNRPFVTSNIIGATSMDQLKENIGSVDIKLNNEIVEKINSIHANIPNPTP